MKKVATDSGVQSEGENVYVDVAERKSDAAQFLKNDAARLHCDPINVVSSQQNGTVVPGSVPNDGEIKNVSCKNYFFSL